MVKISSQCEQEIVPVFAAPAIRHETAQSYSLPFSCHPFLLGQHLLGIAKDIRRLDQRSRFHVIAGQWHSPQIENLGVTLGSTQEADPLRIG